MTKRLATVLLALFLVTAFASLVLAKTTIQYQYNWYGKEDDTYNETFEQIIRLFNTSQSDIVVEGFVVYGWPPDDKLITAIAAGVQADVVHFELSSVIDFAARGLLEPLNGLYTPTKLRTDFFPADAAEVIWNDTVWGVPGYTNARGLFWNVDILDELGLDSVKGPRTMQDLEGLMAKGFVQDADGMFTRLGFIPWGQDFQAGWFWSFGGEVYDYETNSLTLTRSENVQAWNWVQEMARRYPPSQIPQGGLSFLAESLVATIAADNTVRKYTSARPDMDFRTGPIPYPEGGRPGTWGGGVGHVIPAGTKHGDEAKIFVEFLATEGQRLLYEHHHEFPTNLSVANKTRAKLSPDDRRFPLFMQMEARNPRPPLWARLIQGLIGAEPQILSLSATPDAVLQNLQRQLEPLYEVLR